MEKKKQKHDEQAETQQPEMQETPEIETVEATESTDDLQEKYEQLNDSHLRLMAEFENYRKRTLREKADLLKSAGEKILANILPLVDDFERGLEASKNAVDVDAVREGMVLIYDKFVDFLGQNGVKEIETKEQIFDAEMHDAVTTIPAPSDDLKGKIVDCVQKGYSLNDKVIRYPKVVVGE